MNNLPLNPAQAATPQEPSIALAHNMCMTLAQSNEPMQHELARTTAAFQAFMQITQQNFETLAQQNAHLRERLLAADSQQEESEQAHAAERQASQEVVQELRTSLQQTNEKLRTLEATVQLMQGQLNAQEARFNKHRHRMGPNSGWYCTSKPCEWPADQAPVEGYYL